MYDFLFVILIRIQHRTNDKKIQELLTFYVAIIIHFLQRYVIFPFTPMLNIVIWYLQLLNYNFLKCMGKYCNFGVILIIIYQTINVLKMKDVVTFWPSVPNLLNIDCSLYHMFSKICLLV